MAFSTAPMKTATLIQGKVKYKAGKPKDYGNGDRTNIVVTPDNGDEDIKVWGNPDDPIAYLAKGESVTLAYDGKAYTLIALNDENGHPADTRPPTATPEIRATIEGLSADVKEWLSIYNELEQARPDLAEQTKRAAASTLFMKRCEIRRE